jgi:hypothetical protein
MCLMVSNIHLTDTLSHVSEVRALTDTKLPEKQRPHVMENELPLGGWGGVKPTQSLVFGGSVFLRSPPHTYTLYATPVPWALIV